MVRRTHALSVTSVLALLAGLLLGVSPAQAGAGAAQADWAPAARAKIHPGVQMYTKGAQCTSNFVFKDGAGRVYVGYSAHCAGRGAATDTNGCDTGSHPLGTRVRFVSDGTLVTAGTTVGRGTLVYSSWIAMKRRGESRSNVCEANDFALVRVDRDDVRKVNPSVPFWGGPTALGDNVSAGEQVYSWGHSSLRPTTVLSPKSGAALGRSYGGWGSDVYTVTPGVPGDSGSGFLDEKGRAFGTLSTVSAAPFPASNGLGTLARELAYARTATGLDLRLVPGTTKFQPLP